MRVAPYYMRRLPAAACSGRVSNRKESTRMLTSFGLPTLASLHRTYYPCHKYLED